MDILNQIPSSLKNKNVSILGMGISGLGAAKLLTHVGANVFVSEKSNMELSSDYPKILSKKGIHFELGIHSDELFNCDLIVVSPGIAKNTEVIQKAINKNIPIIGELELGFWFTNAPIIAVTGSNGKTTTSKLLESICQTESIHGVLAGNVGTSFCEVVLNDLLKPDTKRLFILEVSSFQTEFLNHFSPFIGIFLNITPDHLNRHGSMENYIRAKIQMSINQNENSYVVYNENDGNLKHVLEPIQSHKIPFSLDPDQSFRFGLNQTKLINKNHEKFISLDEIQLIGNHNYSNIIAAATAAHLLGIKDEHISKSISNFLPISHRMEHFHSENGIQFINDSKATNVDAVACALSSFERSIILIMGGQFKGGNLNELLPHTHKIKSIIAFREAQELIASKFRDAARLMRCNNLEESVILSRKIAQSGDVVLLSPGCASFDQFENYEERGNCFKNLVLSGD
jgi:UDP-N-acetylmuramoylalanine--D-glutamate ligase